MCDPACISEDQKHGIFVIDDVLEFGDAGAAKHLPRFVKILSAGAAHDAPAVAQAAVYGLGVAAVTMGPAFAPFANDAVQVCVIVAAHCRAVDHALPRRATHPPRAWTREMSCAMLM